MRGRYGTMRTRNPRLESLRNGLPRLGRRSPAAGYLYAFSVRTATSGSVAAARGSHGDTFRRSSGQVLGGDRFGGHNYQRLQNLARDGVVTTAPATRSRPALTLPSGMLLAEGSEGGKLRRLQIGSESHGRSAPGAGRRFRSEPSAPCGVFKRSTVWMWTASWGPRHSRSSTRNTRARALNWDGCLRRTLRCHGRRPWTNNRLQHSLQVPASALESIRR